MNESSYSAPEEDSTALGARNAGQRRAREELGAQTSSKPTIDAEIAASFSKHGFVVIQNILSESELSALRAESSELFQLLHTDAGDIDDEIVEDGCVVDVMANCPMQEQDQARTDAAAYMTKRYAHLKSIGVSDASALSTPAHRETMSDLLFDRLAMFASELLSCNVFFFNEHYIVKPSESAVEFRWHRDADEQLAMCLDVATPAYISCWCALDDMTESNGPLRFISKTQSIDTSDSDDVKNEKSSEPLECTAGSVVFFLSDVWHASTSNTSTSYRSAFYAQYSPIKITPSSHDATPLSFAIPCHPLAAPRTKVSRCMHRSSTEIEQVRN